MLFDKLYEIYPNIKLKYTAQKIENTIKSLNHISTYGCD